MKHFRKSQLIGKRIVDVISEKISSNNREVTSYVALTLEDSRGQRTYLRWVTIEETEGADYGLAFIYPGSNPNS